MDNNKDCRVGQLTTNKVAIAPITIWALPSQEWEWGGWGPPSAPSASVHQWLPQAGHCKRGKPGTIVRYKKGRLYMNIKPNMAILNSNKYFEQSYCWKPTFITSPNAEIHARWTLGIKSQEDSAYFQPFLKFPHFPPPLQLRQLGLLLDLNALITFDNHTFYSTKFCLPKWFWHCRKASNPGPMNALPWPSTDSL